MAPDRASGADGRLPAERIDDLALAAMDAAERGRIAESERLARRAVRLGECIGDGHDRDRNLARALRALGTALRIRGQYREAERTFKQALASGKAVFGRTSLEAAELYNDLGMTFRYLGRFDNAEAAYGRAQLILEALPDVASEDLAALFHNLGGLAHARGDFEAAEPLSRRAVDIRSRSIGSRAPAVMLDRIAHAAILAGLGRADEAEATLRDLLPDLESAFEPDHPEVAVALNNLAAILQARGELAESETLYRRVIAIKSARLGANSPALAVPFNNLGTNLRDQGRTDEAAALYARAAELLAGSVEAGHPNLLAVRRNRARLTASTSL